MLEPAVLAFRLVQYGATAVLFGTSLFLLYALPKDGPTAAAALTWPRPLLVTASLGLLVGSLLGLVAQTGVMAGSLAAGLEPSSLLTVATGMGLGRSAMVRAVVAALAIGALVLLRPGNTLWQMTVGLGGVAAVASAWMGHAAATEGSVAIIHIGADVLHILAASVWIGALVAFLILLRKQTSSAEEAQSALHRALRGFGGVGSAAVAVLVATGIVNSWFLVGPAGVERVWTTPYGWVLSAKLFLFGVMLLLAASNRYRLTPALGDSLERGEDRSVALGALRKSLVLETAAALLVLAAVAWLGTLPPIA